MGRGGRSGGGSRSSGGGSRGRSSGGRRSSSSSGRSGRGARSPTNLGGGGFSSSSRRTSSSNKTNININLGGNYSSRRNYSTSSHYNRPRRIYNEYNTLSIQKLIKTIILLAIIMFIAVTSGTLSNISLSNNITRSTIKREPLDKKYTTEVSYVTDELGWISSQTKLIEGMRHFYNKTGVQPHLYITDTVAGKKNPSNTDMDNYAFKLYDELFKDEAHLLVLFHEIDREYRTWYVAGNQAKIVVDSEAADILLDYIDSYYYSDMSEDEFFSKAFADSADRIMEVTKSGWITVILAIVAVVIIMILFVWWSKYKKQKNLEAEQTERILNAPIEELGSGETGLESKYENE